MNKNILVILGAGPLAREFYWHVKSSNVAYDDFLFVNDLSDGQVEVEVGGKKYPVVKNWRFEGAYDFIVGVGSPRIKKILVEKALVAGLVPAPTIVHKSALSRDPNNKLGRGGMLAPGCILTTNIKLSDYVTLNLDTTVGHDTVIGSFSTANPGVHISGNVVVGEGCEIGTGSVIRDYMKIEAGTMVGAQSAVVKSIEVANSTFVGVPARELSKK